MIRNVMKDRVGMSNTVNCGKSALTLGRKTSSRVETASKTIPILLQTVDLQIYPEGGDLVTGLPNRVYFEAVTPAHKPADLAGIVVDSKGREVAAFRSEHEGRGRFTLTPAAGEEYKLKITEPAGIRTTYPLPTAKRNGVVLSALDDVSRRSVRLQLASADSRPVIITLCKRERELDRSSSRYQPLSPSYRYSRSLWR